MDWNHQVDTKFGCSESRHCYGIELYWKLVLLSFPATWNRSL